MSFPPSLISQALRLSQLLTSKGLMLTCAESCTGGLITSCLTSIAGVSSCFECSFVTYSNESKNRILGIPMDIIEQHDAVSEETATAMAEHALRISKADFAISVTGIAGPGGGTAEKPVGLVYIGFSLKDVFTKVERFVFDGDRHAVQHQTAEKALTRAIKIVESNN